MPTVSEPLLKLAGGTVYDPANGIDGVRKDLYVQGGRIVDAPADGEAPARTVDLDGLVVMPGGIDIHSHIGGGKVNIARMLLPENARKHPVEATRITRGGTAGIVPSTFVTGYQYAAMGYTACFEPAMLPANARHAHLEMADVPIVDSGAYVLLGSDDFFLRLLASGASPEMRRDYAAWIVNATQSLGIKVVNPGGINAFKFNQRSLDLDEKHPFYGVTPRDVLVALAQAVAELGIPHSLHVHGCNLGVPGNVDTTLRTIAASEGLPVHLTHLQFHCYGREGDRKFSSGAAAVADAVNANPNISVDVGQIIFGQTVTASGDTMLQFGARKRAQPPKWVCMDIECDAGCGVVPFHYRDRNFVNALQWCVGLELFLLVRDPWRVFLTTDHPNAGPFSAYPHIIRLLMDRSYRNEVLRTLHPAARRHSTLESIDREYTLQEIAIITRAGPARALGLRDLGHLGPGARADITVYSPHRNPEQMFAKPRYVFKNGELVARNGRVIAAPAGDLHVVRPPFDAQIERHLERHFRRYMGISASRLRVEADELLAHGRGGIQAHPLRT